MRRQTFNHCLFYPDAILLLIILFSSVLIFPYFTHHMFYQPYQNRNKWALKCAKITFLGYYEQNYAHTGVF